jgi:hypothetical protein
MFDEIIEEMKRPLRDSEPLAYHSMRIQDGWELITVGENCSFVVEELNTYNPVKLKVVSINGYDNHVWVTLDNGDMYKFYKEQIIWLRLKKDF